MKPANCVVDRAAIEERAWQLIDSTRNQTREYFKSTQSYEADARTLLFEALRASGHLSLVEISGTDLIDINNQVLNVLLNGWSDHLPKAERERRFMELCEELIIQEVHWQIVAGLLPPDTLVSTISDYPDSLTSVQAQQIGYRPQNRKGMVRTIGLIKNADGSLTRVSEQVSRSNASSEASAEFLRSNNIKVQAAGSLDSSVLGTQLLTTRREMTEGVVGLVRRLDQASGATIRYGELRTNEQIEYEDLRSESIRRERAAEGFIQQFAQFTEQLDKKLQSRQITIEQHGAMFRTEACNVLRAICTMNPAYAADCFGEAAVAGFVQASDLVARGDIEGAQQALFANAQFETPPAACGISLGAEGTDSDPGSLLGFEGTLASKLTFGREIWSWGKGLCRIEECPTRPDKTDIGPCSVCRKCQKFFDDRKDPRTEYRHEARLQRSKDRAEARRVERVNHRKNSEKLQPQPSQQAKKAGSYAVARETISV